MRLRRPDGHPGRDPVGREPAARRCRFRRRPRSGATNVNLPVRVLSPGNDGAVDQSNTVDSKAAASNNNSTTQKSDQDQSGSGGCGCASDPIQVAEQSSGSLQGAFALSAADQSGAKNDNSPVRVGSSGNGGASISRTRQVRRLGDQHEQHTQTADQDPSSPRAGAGAAAASASRCWARRPRTGRPRWRPPVRSRTSGSRSAAAARAATPTTRSASGARATTAPSTSRTRPTRRPTRRTTTPRRRTASRTSPARESTSRPSARRPRTGSSGWRSRALPDRSVELDRRHPGAQRGRRRLGRPGQQRRLDGGHRQPEPHLAEGRPRASRARAAAGAAAAARRSRRSASRREPAARVRAVDHAPEAPKNANGGARSGARATAARPSSRTTRARPASRTTATACRSSHAAAVAKPCPPAPPGPAGSRTRARVGFTRGATLAFSKRGWGPGEPGQDLSTAAGKESSGRARACPLGRSRPAGRRPPRAHSARTRPVGRFGRVPLAPARLSSSRACDHGAPAPPPTCDHHAAPPPPPASPRPRPPPPAGRRPCPAAQPLTVPRSLPDQSTAPRTLPAHHLRRRRPSVPDFSCRAPRHGPGRGPRRDAAGGQAQVTAPGHAPPAGGPRGSLARGASVAAAPEHRGRLEPELPRLAADTRAQTGGS